MTSVVGEGEDVRPVLRTFNGNWRLAPGSDSLNDLFASMDVGWLARALVSNITVDVNILQTRESVILTDHSVFGTYVVSLVPDGKLRPVLQIDKRPAPVRCSVDHDSGDLRIETQFPNGTLVDVRCLQSRTQYRQTLSFAPLADRPPGAAPSRPVTARRTFVKVESADEKALAEEAEEAAKVRLAYQAATLAILSTGVSVLPVGAVVPRTPSPPIARAPPAAPVAPAAAPPTPDGTAAGADVAVPTYPHGVAVCSFAGVWTLDRSRSDTLDAMLTLMGVPWIARKIANGLEVTVHVEHDIDGGIMQTADHSSLGIVKNTYEYHGVPRTVTGNDGKVSTVSSTVVAVLPPPVKLSTSPGRSSTVGGCADPVPPDALGCVRIYSVLPDGAGETVDTRCMIEGGRTMRQHLLYRKGDKSVATIRFLHNKEYDAAAFHASVERMRAFAKPPSPAPAAASGAGAGTVLPAPTAPLPPSPGGAGVDARMSSPAGGGGGSGGGGGEDAASERSGPAASRGGSASGGGTAGASASGLDPFFVPMSGPWQVDASRSDPQEPLWTSLGVGWLARKVIGAFESVTTLRHSRAEFVVEEKSGLGAFTQTLALGEWSVVKQADGRHMLMHAAQTAGCGDAGPHWLGDIGTVPHAWVRSAVDGDAADDGDLVSGPAAAGAPDTTERSLIPEARGAGVSLKHLPVPVSQFLASEVVVTTALVDLTPTQRQTFEARQSGRRAAKGTGAGAGGGDISDPDSHDEDDPELDASVAPGGEGTGGGGVPRRSASFAAVTDGLLPPKYATLVATYRMERRGELTVTLVHRDAEGGVLVTARRILSRRETPEQAAIAQVMEAARLQHACTLIVARRAAADELKSAFAKRRAAAAQLPRVSVSLQRMRTATTAAMGMTAWALARLQRTPRVDVVAAWARRPVYAAVPVGACVQLVATADPRAPPPAPAVGATAVTVAGVAAPRVTVTVSTSRRVAPALAVVAVAARAVAAPDGTTTTTWRMAFSAP